MNEIIGTIASSKRLNGEMSSSTKLSCSLNYQSNNTDYNKLDNKPKIKVIDSVFNEETKKITLEEKEKVIENVKTLLDYNILDLIPLDLSAYKDYRHKLNIHEQLPDGVYFVTQKGYIDIVSTSWEPEKNSIMYMQGNGDEFTIIGLAGLLYYYWNPDTEQYEGGYPVTSADLEYELENYKKRWDLGANHLATGSISLVENKFFRKYKETGVTVLTITYPPKIDYYYESLLTVRTASNFQTYKLTDRNYPIFFYGLDCEEGVFVPQPNRQYQIHTRHDGFQGLIANVIGGKYNEI